MVKLTKNAIERILQTMRDDPDCGGSMLRVAIVGGGCAGYSYALDFDDSEEEDMVLKMGELGVCLDPHSAQLLKGTIIDYVDGTFKKGFVFNNPNASRTCGCGNSWA